MRFILSVLRICLITFLFNNVYAQTSKTNPVSAKKEVSPKAAVPLKKGKLVITSDADCNFSVNGKVVGNLKAGKERFVIGFFGDNKIEASMGVAPAPKKVDLKPVGAETPALFSGIAVITDTSVTPFTIEFYGSKIFYEYIRSGNKKMVEDCLKRNPGLINGSEEELSPLLIAVQKEKADLVLLFLEKGADINKRTEETPLCAAIKMTKPDIAKLLVDKGAALEIKGEDDLTPLQLAVSWKKFELVKLLLDKGADKNIKDKEGKSLLKIAYEKGLDSIFEELKKYGVEE